MRPDLTATPADQFRDLCCLPGARGNTPATPINRTRNGHHWHDEPSWRRYRCAICNITSRNPDTVLLTCEDVRIDAEKHRRHAAGHARRLQELLQQIGGVG